MDNNIAFRKLVGENIRYFRRKLGLSQKDLAFMADLTNDFISRVERGVDNISIDSIFRIGEVLKIDPYLLFVSELRRSKEVVEMENINKSK